MVNWRSRESTDRLVAAMIAAHPNLRLQYDAMAAYFGQDATYDTIECRFRRYRKIANDLHREAHQNGVEMSRGTGRNTLFGTPRSAQSTPRTPRSGRTKSGGGITKYSSSKTAQFSLPRAATVTPTKPSKYGKLGSSMTDAICLDDDKDMDIENGADDNLLHQREFPNSNQENGSNSSQDNNVFVKQKRANGRSKGYRTNTTESPSPTAATARRIRASDIFCSEAPRSVRVDSRSNGYVDEPASAV